MQPKYSREQKLAKAHNLINEVRAILDTLPELGSSGSEIEPVLIRSLGFNLLKAARQLEGARKAALPEPTKVGISPDPNVAIENQPTLIEDLIELGNINLAMNDLAAARLKVDWLLMKHAEDARVLAFKARVEAISFAAGQSAEVSAFDKPGDPPKSDEPHKPASLTSTPPWADTMRFD